MNGQNGSLSPGRFANDELHDAARYKITVVKTMKFTEFEKLVQSEFANGVLQLFFSQIVYRREYLGQYYPGYEIGLTVKSCKFLFVWEEGGGVMIAPPSSRFENTSEGWFSLGRIICFVTNQPFIWESPYQHIPRDDQIIQTLQAARKAVAPYVSQVISLFSSDEKVADWIFNYEEYEDEQFRLKYPSFYESYKQSKQKSKEKNNKSNISKDIQ